MTPLDDSELEKFIARLAHQTERPRLKKALKMLKAESFQLYSEVEDDEVRGVVKSQTNPDLVYSCQLSSAGDFSCCTQNLYACGGLRGMLCKHLLVLLIGLVRGGELERKDVLAWMRSSRRRRPELDKDRQSDILLRYKGVEAGEVDWRPTETVPEDYFAL